MGAVQSKDKMYCTRYLDGKGPPPLSEQSEGDIQGIYKHTVDPGLLQGNQPEGQMTWVILRRSVQGYPDCDTIQLNYVFEDGIQTEEHPNPGQTYYGLRTPAYLPQNSEGRKVLKLLERAFNQRLVFTVATRSTGEEAVTWSDIPHKSVMEDGGAESYPDPDYLKTVRKVLKAKGIK